MKSKTWHTRLLSLIVSLSLIISLTPSTFAAESGKIVIDPNAGGEGSASGITGSGDWSTRYQGYRMYIIGMKFDTETGYAIRDDRQVAIQLPVTKIVDILNTTVPYPNDTIYKYMPKINNTSYGIKNNDEGLNNTKKIMLSSLFDLQWDDKSKMFDTNNKYMPLPMSWGTGEGAGAIANGEKLRDWMVQGKIEIHAPSSKPVYVAPTQTTGGNKTQGNSNKNNSNNSSSSSGSSSSNKNPNGGYSATGHKLEPEDWLTPQKKIEFNNDACSDIVDYYASAVERYGREKGWQMTQNYISRSKVNIEKLEWSEPLMVEIRKGLARGEAQVAASHRVWLNSNKKERPTDKNFYNKDKPDKNIKGDKELPEPEKLMPDPPKGKTLSYQDLTSELQGAYLYSPKQEDNLITNENGVSNTGYMDELLLCQWQGVPLFEFTQDFINGSRHAWYNKDSKKYEFIHNTEDLKSPYIVMYRYDENGEGTVIDTQHTMAVNNLALIVEPIIYIRPYDKNGNSGGWFYGTITELAQLLVSLEGKSMGSWTWYNPTTVNGYATYLEDGTKAHYMTDYKNTINKVGSRSLRTLKDAKLVVNKGAGIENGWLGEQYSPFIINPTWEVEYVPLEIMANKYFGFAIQSYQLSDTLVFVGSGTPETKTWDKPKYPKTPGPNPDPSTIPLLEEEPRDPNDPNKSSVRNINIVKVYSEIDNYGEETAEEHHIETFISPNNPQQIYVQHEENYKVTDYKISDVKPSDIGITSDTDWYTITADLLSNQVYKEDTFELEDGQVQPVSYSNEDNLTTWPSPGNITDALNPVQIVEPYNTLYVKLVKVDAPPPEDSRENSGNGQLDITESQISKSVSTDDARIGSTMYNTWGNYKFKGYIPTYAGGGCNVLLCSGSYSRLAGDHYIEFEIARDNEIAKLEIQKIPKANYEFYNTFKDINKDEYGDTIKYPNGSITNSSYSFEINEATTKYLSTIWRGGYDNLTLAKYKQTSDVNTYNKIASIVPIGNKPSSDRVLDIPSINWVERLQLNALDGHVSAACTKCGAAGGSDTATLTTNISKKNSYIDFNATVGIHTYAGTKKKTASENIKALAGYSVGFSGATSKNSASYAKLQTSDISFYPYIRMSFEVSRDAEKKAKNTSLYERTSYILSDKKSSILPTNAAEVSWYNANQANNGYGIQMTSQQWSLHKRATEGTDGWQGVNKVLPGGALYSLSTQGSESIIKTVTYSTYVDKDSRDWIDTNSSKYTQTSIIDSNNSYIAELKEVLENYRLVQWVNKDYKLTNAWDNLSGAVKITSGDQSLSSLGLKVNTSTDSKYVLTDSTAKEGALEADIDIEKESYQTTVYKCFTDTQGNVYVATSSSAASTTPLTTTQLEQLVSSIRDVCGTKDSGTKAIKIGTKDQKLEDILELLKLSYNEIYMMNLKTGFISNVINSVTRNKGNDSNAFWVTDGKWYNEAFDGIYVVAQTMTYQIGLGTPSKRIAVLDPRLCPSQGSKGEVFTNAHLSQFRLNDKSAKAQDKSTGYLATFDGIEVKIPDVENMFISRPFSIPNATVQDLS